MKEKTKVHEEHKDKAPKEINLALIIVSTSRFLEMKKGKKTSDKTIPKVKRLLNDNLSISLTFTKTIPDSEEHINKILTELMKDDKIDSIIFSGGTGLSPKDITYETIEPRLEKKFDGFGELFRHLSYNEIGTSAMLSRATAGILKVKKHNKVIFLLPGSPNAVRLALQHIIIPELGHILYLINKEEWNDLEKLRKIGFSKLTPLDDAMEKLFSKIHLNPIEEINIKEALNRTIAENIISGIDIPPFDRSAMDGYAIKAEDSFRASPKNPKKIKLTGTIEIGEALNLRINKGETIRISTGAPMPEGSDAVVKIEDTEIENNIVSLYTSLVPGKNISKRGEDLEKSTLALSKGTELKAEHIALLTSLGSNKVKVRTKPKISIFSSGDELIEPGIPLESGKIYNSNTPMISALVNLYGGIVIRSESVKDDKNAIKNRLHEAAEDSQMIIFTGGTSVGTKDYLPEIINESGSVLVHGIAMRPGSPVLIGFLNKTLVFCLPGTPVAAYVSFLKISGPAMRKILGCSVLDPRIEVMAIIEKDVPVTGLGFLHYLRVKVEKHENEFIAIPVKLKGSGVISSLTASDGIVEIPPDQEGLKKGERVIVKFFPK